VRSPSKATLNTLLDNIAGKDGVIRSFIELDVLEALYRNGINITAADALVFSDIIKDTSVTFMSNDLDELRDKWKSISSHLQP
jgi:hypothetical protein